MTRGCAAPFARWISRLRKTTQAEKGCVSQEFDQLVVPRVAPLRDQDASL